MDLHHLALVCPRVDSSSLHSFDTAATLAPASSGSSMGETVSKSLPTHGSHSRVRPACRRHPVLLSAGRHGMATSPPDITCVPADCRLNMLPEASLFE